MGARVCVVVVVVLVVVEDGDGKRRTLWMEGEKERERERAVNKNAPGGHFTRPACRALHGMGIGCNLGYYVHFLYLYFLIRQYFCVLWLGSGRVHFPYRVAALAALPERRYALVEDTPVAASRPLLSSLLSISPVCLSLQCDVAQ